jgi:hypothetical protein
MLTTSHGPYRSKSYRPRIEYVQSLLPVLLWPFLVVSFLTLLLHPINGILYDRGAGFVCFRLVVHIFVRTRTFFRHLVRAFILCAAPEAVVVFRS